MTTNHQHIESLLDKALNQQLSAAEMHQLLELAGNNQYESAFIAAMEKQIGTFSPGNADDIQYWMERKAEIYERLSVNRSNAPSHRVRFLKTAWFRYAAAVIIVFGIGVYIWTTNKKSTSQPVLAQETMDIAPGRDGAILTLADGSQVVLDSLGNGVIATQNGSQALIKDGKLVYDPTLASTGEVDYNTITTPKGRQFQVTLPDGTKVWLNAASAVTYPTVFPDGKRREVIIRGEVYFEVTRNPSRPFLVNIVSPATGKELGQVEVLGTAFNINAYEDEPWISVSLLEGSIKVGSRVMKPGQAFANGKLFEADVEKAIAWKNGVFNFDDADLPSVLRQISRWYDVDVEYPKGIPDRIFGGKIERSLTLSQVLLILERMEVLFQVTQDKKLIVLPWPDEEVKN